MHVNEPCATIREEEFERSDTSSRSSCRRLPKYFGVVGKLQSATRTRTKERRDERGVGDSELLVRVAQPVFPPRMRRAAWRRRNCVRDKKNRSLQIAHISHFVRISVEEDTRKGTELQEARSATRDRKRRIQRPQERGQP